ncbi:hypothetical protein QFC24_002046 [Naganishia onofrii]|uniref:Uncharacterized protein n=1 Tax=Naganishia onofrii TaxID=1851511 RepID=A0ACC2XSG1_9TREE|nr:hypothetical protein QFC24_002046 [Naganishia onofrii]
MASRLERRAYRLAEKHQRDDSSSNASDNEDGQDGKPAGGYDSTPLKPSGQTCYKVKLTFHRATNLPVSDLHGLASDPYLMVTLNTPTLKSRHESDPPLRFRTRTHHGTTNPVWNDEWIIGGVPEAGFEMDVRIMDEDRMNHDDRLGDVKAVFYDIGGSAWTDVKERPMDIKKKHASKRVNMMRAAYTVIHPVRKAFQHHPDDHGTSEHHAEELFISIEVLENMKPDDDVGKAYTIGPCRWMQHYSPLIGRMLGTKEGSSSDSDDEQAGLSAENGGNSGEPAATAQGESNQQRNSQTSAKDRKDQNKAEKFDFQANEFQLQGPVPNELYHRYVNFKSFVHGMFQKTGIRGRILNHALHHQHAQVYQYDKNTKTGAFAEPCQEMSRKFLDLVHYDEGGRLFTYVITLDALMRFTETGEEFGIDLLSKHTMHSDVNLYIAWSGEFLIRRLKQPDAGEQGGTHPPDPIPGGPPREAPPKDPKYYEAIFDNDSGTYRPNADLLPVMQKFLEKNFPGLKIVMMSSTDDKLKKIKEQQKKIKKKEGDQRTFVQNHGSDSGSDGGISSSDESDLEKRVQSGGKTVGGKLERAFNLLQFSKSGKQE